MLKSCTGLMADAVNKKCNMCISDPWVSSHMQHTTVLHNPQPVANLAKLQAAQICNTTAVCHIWELTQRSPWCDIYTIELYLIAMSFQSRDLTTYRAECLWVTDGSGGAPLVLRVGWRGREGPYWPIRSQYPGHVITLRQWEGGTILGDSRQTPTLLIRSTHGL